MQIYHRVKEARKLLKMTQKELSDAIGISQKDVSLLESGKKSLLTQKKIVLVLELLKLKRSLSICSLMIKILRRY